MLNPNQFKYQSQPQKVELNPTHFSVFLALGSAEASTLKSNLEAKLPISVTLTAVVGGYDVRIEGPIQQFESIIKNMIEMGPYSV